MILLDGTRVAHLLEESLRDRVSEFSAQLKLAVVLVGNDATSLAYIRQKESSARRVGINLQLYKMSEHISTNQLVSHLHDLNEDSSVHGIIVQVPLLESVDTATVLSAVDPAKDVDGFHPLNTGKLMLGQPGLRPCTPRGIIDLLDYYKIPIAGQRVVVIGRSLVVGRPAALMFLNRSATVTICHRQTVDLAQITRTADILVSATGSSSLVTASMVKPGAVVVDAGWSFLNRKISGDVAFDEVSEIASAISPVPGGVGPMTVVTLMRNVVTAYIDQCGALK